MATYGGNTYTFCGEAAIHADASATCASGGAKLLKITDAQENEWLRQMAQANAASGASANEKLRWIGLNDQAQEGQFVWEDGTALVYSNWSGGSPNNEGGDRDCVVRLDASGKWMSKPCGDDPNAGNIYLGFVCESAGE